MKFGVTFVAAFLFVVSIAHAHEAIFSWTYTTDLTPKGHGEFEQWITTRWEKKHGSYSAVDFREEFEYGVTDNVQMAIYLNHHYVHANDDVPAADPVHPGNRLPGAYETGGEDVHAGHNPATAFDSYHFESVSLEGIYRLLSPYKRIESGRGGRMANEITRMAYHRAQATMRPHDIAPAGPRLFHAA